MSGSILAGIEAKLRDIGSLLQKHEDESVAFHKEVKTDTKLDRSSKIDAALHKLDSMHKRMDSIETKRADAVKKDETKK